MPRAKAPYSSTSENLGSCLRYLQQLKANHGNIAYHPYLALQYQTPTLFSRGLAYPYRYMHK